jgi:hypothetical protein
VVENNSLPKSALANFGLPFVFPEISHEGIFDIAQAFVFIVIGQSNG